MRTAHLIITYTDPKQTERMIRKMIHPDFDFYIHVDKKNDIKSHLYLETLQNVYFIRNRVDVRWAGYNTIRAIFNGIKEICDSGRKYSFINLLSGQDYPLKPIDQLANFFKENKGKEFLAYKDMVNDWQDELFRVRKFHLMNVRFRGRVLFRQETLEKILNYIFGERRMPYNLHPYGDSMFWMLSPELALYVTNKVENDKRLKRFFYFTWASDELLFQTIIMNSPYKERVINKNYRYIDWSENKANPKILKEEDFQELKESSMLFARKFDMAKNVRILDMIDSIL